MNPPLFKLIEALFIVWKIEPPYFEETMQWYDHEIMFFKEYRNVARNVF